MSGCPFNFGLLCSNKTRCNKCGWNPEIREKRVRQILNAHPEYISRNVQPCPFCGAEPRITRLSNFVSIACGNKGCEMACTGYCASFAIAARKWNRRVYRGKTGDKK